MKREQRRGIFWWILLGILLALLLGYVLKNELAHNHVAPQTQTTQQAKTEKALSEKPESEAVSREQISGIPSSKTGKQGMTSTAGAPGAATSHPKKKVDYCSQLENDVRDFFSYLDSKPYVQHLDLGEPVTDHVRDMVRRLSTHPPVPAGEGIDLRILTKNIFHLYRVLGLKDIRLVREILRNERDSLETNLEILYRWLMAGDKCPDRLGLRPPFQVLYKYAGFLVNTVGGRACLSRRSNLGRILATYYCLLIVHEADTRGLNNYGIDIYPVVISLKNEMSHYHDLEFQSDYLDKLTKMESYYIEKR